MLNALQKQFVGFFEKFVFIEVAKELPFIHNHTEYAHMPPRQLAKEGLRDACPLLFAEGMKERAFGFSFFGMTQPNGFYLTFGKLVAATAFSMQFVSKLKFQIRDFAFKIFPFPLV